MNKTSTAARVSAATTRAARHADAALAVVITDMFESRAVQVGAEYRPIRRRPMARNLTRSTAAATKIARRVR